MSFIEGAKGAGQEAPRPEGLVFAFSAESSELSADGPVCRPSDFSADDSAVRASVPDGDRGVFCPESAPVATSKIIKPLSLHGLIDWLKELGW